jgi:hypothetical protein
MDAATEAKLMLNLANAHKMASNYVWVATGLIWTVYLSLPLDQQQTLVAHLPVPVWALPIVGSVLGIVARLWPQKSLAPSEASPAAPPP